MNNIDNPEFQAILRETISTNEKFLKWLDGNKADSFDIEEAFLIVQDHIGSLVSFQAEASDEENVICRDLDDGSVLCEIAFEVSSRFPDKRTEIYLHTMNVIVEALCRLHKDGVRLPSEFQSIVDDYEHGKKQYTNILDRFRG